MQEGEEDNLAPGRQRGQFDTGDNLAPRVKTDNLIPRVKTDNLIPRRWKGQFDTKRVGRTI